MKRSFFICCTILALAFCSCSDDDSLPPDGDFPIAVNSTLIGRGALGGAGEENIPKQNLAIRDNSTWQALIGKMDAVNNVSGTFTQTDIDFSENIVIAVFTEVKTHGSSIKIDSIRETQDNVQVFVGDPVPEATAVISQPYYIAKIPDLDKPVVFD